MENTENTEKAVKYFELVKASQKKYMQSEKGKAKISEIKKRHYQKCKAENPDFLKQQAEKVKRNLLARKAKKAAELLLSENVTNEN
jgi:hypothetical protein